jgi:hypothetical protein
MRAAIINTTTSEILYMGEEGQGRASLPGNVWVSPVDLGWEYGDFKCIEVTDFVAPEGKQNVGLPSYEVIADKVVETYQTEDIPVPPVLPAQIEKATILSRLTDEQLEQAISLMTVRQQERWRMPGYPMINVDDPELLAMLQAVGADPEVVLAL